MERVVTLTLNPTVDAATRVERVVADRKLRCEEPRREPGGGGLNVARAVHRLGGEARAVYAAGGLTGERLERLLADEGVDAVRVEIEGETRENLAVEETSTDRQFRFGMPGPPLQEEEWRRCLDAITEMDPAPRWVVASGSLPPEVPTDLYARVGKAARAVGARMVLDSSGDALREGLGDGVFLLKPNLSELAELAGRDLETEEDQEEAARDLVEGGRAEAVLVSLGRAGAMLITGDGCERIRAPTVQIRSKVGAGDSTVAGMILALARGRPLPEAARFGVAAGAAAVTTPGSELCPRDETESLFERIRGREAAGH